MYVILLSLTIINDYYMGFLVCEFIFLYFFCQKFESIKDLFIKGIRIAFYSIISVGLLAFSLFSIFINTVQKSPYQISDSNTPNFTFTSEFIQIFNYGKIAPPAVIIDKNSNSTVNMYCGLLFVLLIPLYILCKKINLSERIRKVSLLALLFISFNNPLLNYIMHGLHKQVFVPNRFSLFYIFLLITLIYDFVQNIDSDYNKKHLIIFYVWTLLLGSLFLISSNTAMLFPTVISLIFIVVYLVLTNIYFHKQKRLLISKIISLFFILELLITAFNYTRYTIYSSHINLELNSYNNVSIITKRNNLDQGHVRTEYLSSEKNSAMIINTESVSFFTSSINRTNYNMIGCLGVDIPVVANNIGYGLSNPLSDLFLNVKYHIINQYFKVNETYTFMNKIDEINNISLYENPYNVGFGFLIKNDNPILDINNKLESGYEYNTFIDLHDEIAFKITGQPLYDQIEFDTDPEKINNDPNATYVMSDYSNYIEGDPNSFVTVCIGIGANLKGDFYLNYGYFSHLSSKTSDTQEVIYLQMSADQYEYYLGNTFYLVRLNEDTMQKLHDTLSESVLYDVHDDGNDIIGTIDAHDDGIVYVSLPFRDDFKVFVDNKEVEMISVFKGIGIPVKSGNHKITIRYINKGINTGITISIVTLIFYILFLICVKIFKRKKSITPKFCNNDNIDEKCEINKRS